MGSGGWRGMDGGEGATGLGGAQGDEEGGVGLVFKRTEGSSS